MFHDSALEPTLRDWVSVLANDRDEALMHLLNLVLASAGCPGKLTKDQVSDLEDVSETLGQLQNQVNVVRCLYFHIDEAFKYFGQLKKFVREIQDVQHGYPLLPKKRGRAHLKFQKTMGEFWARLMARTQAQHLLLADRAWLLDALYQWLGAMSSSAFRPFRHTATFVSLCIQTALCDVARSLNASWMTLSRQSEASARKKTASSSEKLEELRASKELLDDMMTVLFDG